MQKFLFYNKFIVYIYMFRALFWSSSGGQIVLYSIWYHSTLGGCPVKMLREDCARDGHLQVWWYQMLY